MKRTAASISFTLVVNRFVSRTMSTIGVATLVSHEFGHYRIAKAEGLKPFTPVIIGLGPIGLGYVKTLKGSKSQRRRVGLAGPMAGSVASITSLLLFTLIGFTPGIIISSICILSEIFNLLFGSDSHKVFT
jgi:hypothetical protein